MEGLIRFFKNMTQRDWFTLVVMLICIGVPAYIAVHSETADWQNYANAAFFAILAFTLSFWLEHYNKEKDHKTQNLTLMGNLTIELKKVWDNFNNTYSSEQGVFDTPILESTAREQVETFAGCEDILRCLPEIRRMTKLISQKKYAAMLAHIEAVKQNPSQPGVGDYEKQLLGEVRTHTDHLKLDLEEALWDMAHLLEHEIENFPKEWILKGLVDPKKRKQGI